MSKADQINQLLLEELAIAINREIPIEDALVTVTYVDCSPDLKQARVGLSILPDRLAGTLLKKISSKTGVLVNILKKKTKLRRLPHFKWEFDSTEREANKIEELIAEI